MICAVLQSRNNTGRVLELLKEIRPDSDILMYTDPKMAEPSVLGETCRIVIIDPQIGNGNGLNMAKQWLAEQENLNVIFLAETDRYMREAFNMFVSDYILWPCSQERLAKSLDHLRYPVPDSRQIKRVQVRCFGNFEVTVDGEPLNFRYNKTKEMLAFLIDREGAMMTNAEISAVLWEDTKHQAYFKSIRKDLIDTLTARNAAGILSLGWGKIGIRTDRVDCDYYKWLKKQDYNHGFFGEYMTQYSWSEDTNGRLQMMTQTEW